MQRSGAPPTASTVAPELARITSWTPPFLSLYIATEAKTENAAQRAQVRWKAVRRKLAGEGVPEPMLSWIDDHVPDAHHHGQCLCAMTSADGGRFVEHLPTPPRFEVASWSNLPR